MIKIKLLKILSMKEKEKYFLFLVSLLSLFILFSIFEIYDLNRKLRVKNQILIDKSIFADNAQLEQETIDEFITNYLNNIFSGSSQDKLSWLKKHSSEIFYENVLKTHIEKREKNKMVSDFLIKRIYSEKISADQGKFIIFGEEKFINNSYKNRNLVIEITINFKELVVETINSIKELNE